MNAFGLPDNAAVITTSYVMRERMPILYVTHETDVKSEEAWEFHCGNGDYSHARLMLVALIEIIALDATVAEVADMPSGYAARREAPSSPWVVAPLA